MSDITDKVHDKDAEIEEDESSEVRRSHPFNKEIY